MPFFRLLMIAAAFSSGGAFTPGVHAPAVRRVAAVSPVVPTVMMASGTYTIVRKDKNKKNPDPFDFAGANEVFHEWENAVLGGTNPIKAAVDLEGDTNLKKFKGTKNPTFQFRISEQARVIFELDETRMICNVYAESEHPKLLADAYE